MEGPIIAEFSSLNALNQKAVAPKVGEIHGSTKWSCCWVMSTLTVVTSSIYKLKMWFMSLQWECDGNVGIWQNLALRTWGQCRTPVWYTRSRALVPSAGADWECNINFSKCHDLASYKTSSDTTQSNFLVKKYIINYVFFNVHSAS